MNHFVDLALSAHPAHRLETRDASKRRWRPSRCKKSESARWITGVAHQKGKPKLVEVAIAGQANAGFMLVLGNGRRIESSWSFAEADLARLVRVAEA